MPGRETDYPVSAWDADKNSPWWTDGGFDLRISPPLARRLNGHLQLWCRGNTSPCHGEAGGSIPPSCSRGLPSESSIGPPGSLVSVVSTCQPSKLEWWVRIPHDPLPAHGETGRRAGLRGQWRNPSRFDSWCVDGVLSMTSRRRWFDQLPSSGKTAQHGVRHRVMTLDCDSSGAGAVPVDHPRWHSSNG